MPFDGADFQATPRPPRRAHGERVFGLLFLVIAICLLVMPISAAALVDIVHYMRGG